MLRECGNVIVLMFVLCARVYCMDGELQQQSNNRQGSLQDCAEMAMYKECGSLSIAGNKARLQKVGGAHYNLTLQCLH